MLAASRIAILGALVASGLASCTSTHAERDWFYAARSAPEPAKLGYGREGSDDVDLMLWCKADKHQVLLEPVGADDDHFRRLALTSGAVKLDVSLTEDADLGAVAGVRFDDPLLSAFRATGRLSMVVDDKRRLRLDASSPEGRRQIRQFFEACG